MARRRLKTFAEGLSGGDRPACADHVKAFDSALQDDLNVSQALGVVHDAMKASVPVGAKKALLQMAERIFAVGLFEAEQALEPELQSLVGQREAAREAKNFALSDQLRLALEERGVLVEDTKQGQKWRRK